MMETLNNTMKTSPLDIWPWFTLRKMSKCCVNVKVSENCKLLPDAEPIINPWKLIFTEKRNGERI